jgi:hypothetical protein
MDARGGGGGCMKDGRIPDRNGQLLNHPKVYMVHVNADGGILEKCITLGKLFQLCHSNNIYRY